MNDSRENMRSQMRIVCKGISSGDRRAGTKAIADIGVDFLASGGRKVVAGFIPVGEEMTPLLLMQELYHRQQPMVLPKWSGDEGVRFFRWWPGERLQQGAGGQYEPVELENEEEPDYLLVPMLGFDMVGNRLGFGGGIYRDLIKTLRARRQVVVVGVGFSELALPMPLEDDEDGHLDWILTPHGVRRMAH